MIFLPTHPQPVFFIYIYSVFVFRGESREAVKGNKVLTEWNSLDDNGNNYNQQHASQPSVLISSVHIAPDP